MKAKDFLSSQTSLSAGKRARLVRMLYEYGPGNGTLLLLPLDQGLEHGPLNFLDNPAAADTNFQFKLAIEGNYSGIAVHVGLAEKYFPQYAGRIPLVLKINGKTNVPSDKKALSPLTATVADAVRLGADAIGYTLYVGSPKQAQDFSQYLEVRREAEKYGMPIIMWAYPRGEAIDEKGGRDSIYAVDYAARVAEELGADIVKINVPKAAKPGMPESYVRFAEGKTEQQLTDKVVASAGRTLVLFSGGSKVSDEDLLTKVESCMQAGATGLIFGRNMWQRPYDQALAISKKVHEVMARYGS
ncbi:MAG: fructose-bisphosphate aldolase [bacterium]